MKTNAFYSLCFICSIFSAGSYDRTRNGPAFQINSAISINAEEETMRNKNPFWFGRNNPRNWNLREGRNETRLETGFGSTAIKEPLEESEIETKQRKPAHRTRFRRNRRNNNKPPLIESPSSSSTAFISSPSSVALSGTSTQSGPAIRIRFKKDLVDKLKMELGQMVADFRANKIEINEKNKKEFCRKINKLLNMDLAFTMFDIFSSITAGTDVSPEISSLAKELGGRLGITDIHIGPQNWVSNIQLLKEDTLQESLSSVTSEVSELEKAPLVDEDLCESPRHIEVYNQGIRTPSSISADDLLLERQGSFPISLEEDLPYYVNPVYSSDSQQQLIYFGPQDSFEHNSQLLLHDQAFFSNGSEVMQPEFSYLQLSQYQPQQYNYFRTEDAQENQAADGFIYYSTAEAFPYPSTHSS